MRGVRAVWCVAVLGLASVGCNVQALTSFSQLIYIQPQAVAAAPANEVANPGQKVLLDGSQSGIRLGNGTFLPATAIDMTFNWQIVAALDTTTGQDITPIPADAQLSNVNSSQTTFSATTLADYNIQLTVSNGVYTGSSTTGVRIISP